MSIFAWLGQTAGQLAQASQRRPAPAAAMDKSTRMSKIKGRLSQAEAHLKKCEGVLEAAEKVRSEKFGDAWIVELLLDDLIDWHNW